jgi:tripartite-type tricarboxylate transporter receptor subunit TctC
MSNEQHFIRHSRLREQRKSPRFPRNDNAGTVRDLDQVTDAIVISGRLLSENGRLLRLFAFVAISLLLLAHYQPALAQTFYKDKTIRFIVGQAAGGGYDTYTRTIARYMGKYIPGEPTTIVDNMTGAGSLVAANYLYNNAKPDGLTIGNWNSALVFNQAMGDVNVKFDARKFGWIGAPTKSVPVCLIMGFTGVKTLDEIVKSGKALRMGGTGPGSHSIDMPLMLNKMVGTKFTVVSGYQGTAQIRIALQRREVDGLCTNWDSVLATQKELLDAKGDERMIPFIIHSRIDDPDAKNVTLVSEAVKDEANLRAYRVYMAQMEYSRPLTIAPGTPKDRLQTLRRAFKATLADSDFLAQANKLKLDINHVSGEESEKWVSEVLSISPKMKEELKYLSPVK